jgi:hypothetical protein
MQPVYHFHPQHQPYAIMQPYGNGGMPVAVMPHQVMMVGAPGGGVRAQGGAHMQQASTPSAYAQQRYVAIQGDGAGGMSGGAVYYAPPEAAYMQQQQQQHYRQQRMM